MYLRTSIVNLTSILNIPVCSYIQDSHTMLSYKLSLFIYMYTLTHVYLFLVYTPPCPYHSLQEDVVEVKIDNSVYATQRCVSGYIAIMYFMPLMPLLCLSVRCVQINVNC